MSGIERGERELLKWSEILWRKEHLIGGITAQLEKMPKGKRQKAPFPTFSLTLKGKTKIFSQAQLFHCSLHVQEPLLDQRSQYVTYQCDRGALSRPNLLRHPFPFQGPEAMWWLKVSPQEAANWPKALGRYLSWYLAKQVFQNKAFSLKSWLRTEHFLSMLFSCLGYCLQACAVKKIQFEIVLWNLESNNWIRGF